MVRGVGVAENIGASEVWRCGASCDNGCEGK